MKKIWAGINPANVWDGHVHLIGVGDSGSGVWFNPNMDSLLHPILKIQKTFYMHGGCVDAQQVDKSYVDRLVALMSEMPNGCKAMLFAFDWFHDSQGNIDRNQSIFHIPNTYAAQVAKEYSQYFEWVASIHPYRVDAVDALEKAHAEGARAIKWLPSGMGIDTASEKCDAFYRAASRLRIPIISHTGAESAVQGGDQSYGNPLKIRRALDAGVQVVLAHCASDGYDNDLDNGGKKVRSLELFVRLMNDPRYKELLYGEISAITLINHAAAIPTILENSDWLDRLTNGSDYPLPAILPLISVTKLASMGLLDETALPFLKELHSYHPLMFDFAVKRLIQWNGKSFPSKVFETRSVFQKI
ncbi:amidohydrolase family protein [Methylovorus sp. MM2]|uniref:amidohydrolase family protein n=1 Tax=Methylovorus sp. MM2 TaxID=1848038 RepID=UPI0020B8330B|nr:amidohydrolase family protein [Methylovorus sp. MM2]